MSQECLDSKKASQVSNAFSLVLNDSGADLFKSSKEIMKKIIRSDKYKADFIAVGFHDKDRNDFGDLKTNHYHLVIEFDGRMRLGTCFDFIQDIFNCNDNQISIEKCSDVGAQTRYILHLDDVDKYQYPGNILVTNCFERCEFYLSHIRIRDEKHLIEVIDNNPSKRDLLRILGAKQYKKWRFAIIDLLDRRFN